MSTQEMLLCPGQGAQAVGMGRAWYDASSAARAVFDQADAVLGDTLGAKLTELCFAGPKDVLDRTNVSQPAIYTCSMACHAGLTEMNEAGTIAETAGLSLGEYSALALAGVFDFKTGLELVAARGRLMQEAAEASKGGMVAIIGGDDAAAEAIAADAAKGGVLVPANFNAPGQVVLSGDVDACERAAEVAGERGLRATVLAVAGAFHSPHMQPAADAMGDILASAALERPAVPVWSNVTAAHHDSENMELLRERLVQQITSPVRWAQSCAAMPAADMLEYVELAPGTVLRGLMRRIDRRRKVKNHDQPMAGTSSQSS